MESLTSLAEQMLRFTEELHHWKLEKKKLVQDITLPPAGVSKEEVLDSYNLHLLQLLSYLDNLNEQMAIAAHTFSSGSLPAVEPTTNAAPTVTAASSSPFGGMRAEDAPVPETFSEATQEIFSETVPEAPQPVQRVVSLDHGNFQLIKLNKKERKALLQELGFEKRKLQQALQQPEVLPLEQEYTIYQERIYGKIANFFFRGISLRLGRNYFGELRQSLLRADIRVLSTTYISSLFLTTFLVFLAVFAGMFLYGTLFSSGSVINLLLRSSGAALFGALFTYFLYYSAPLFIANSHKRAIKNDLPFVIIHMAAVAGSGAQPVSMFHLVLSTGEYKGLEREIKKVLNYVNLFGYSLTSALRAVSLTTPNKEFKDLLNGIISVVESGGDLKYYLKGKADDAFTNYKLERRRYVESLSTYSDVYIGVLLAAPLLFIVTLTIINLLGGTIGGFSVKTISFFGTFIGMPLLNIAFLLFLNLIQPEV